MSLSSAVALRWSRTLVCPASFLSDGPQSDAPFPPPGPAGQFPGFTSTSERSDSLPPIPPHFVILRLAVPLFALVFRSRRRPNAAAAGQGHCANRLPLVPVHRAGTAGPRRFLGNPIADMPCSPTPVGPRRQANFGAWVLPSAFRDGVGSHNDISFEARSHGLPTRCLRLATRVARGHPRLASGCWPALPGGIGYPQGSSARFQSLLHLILLAQALPVAPRNEIWLRSRLLRSLHRSDGWEEHEIVPDRDCARRR